MKFKQRLITSSVIMLVLVFAFVTRIWTPYVFDMLILSLAVMGAVEVARVLERQQKYTNFIVVATMPGLLYILITIVLSLKLQWQYLLLMLLGAIVAYFAIVFLITLLSKKTSAAEMEKYELKNVKLYRYALDKAIYSLTVLVYPTLLFMALILLNHFNELSFIVDMGHEFKMATWFALISVFVVTIMTDTMSVIR